MLFLRSWFNSIAAALLLALLSPLAALAGSLGHGETWGRWVMGLYGRLMFPMCGVRYELYGSEHVPATGGVVVMANHSSHMDSPLIATWMPRLLRYVAKKELFRIPILGHMMRALDFVEIDRYRRDRAVGAVDSGTAKVRDGAAVLIFPEGTRSKDGELQPFKKGGIIMALQAGVPIVPVGIAGAYEVMSPHTLALSPGHLVLVAHPPIDLSDLTVEQRDEALERAQEAVSAARHEAIARRAGTWQAA